MQIAANMRTGAGFAVKFDNGFVLSVQYSDFSYCDNHMGNSANPSKTAEIAVFDADGNWVKFDKNDDGTSVKGWVPINQVFDLIPIIAKFDKGTPASQIVAFYTEEAA